MNKQSPSTTVQMGGVIFDHLKSYSILRKKAMAFFDTPRNLLLLRADSVFFQNIPQSGYGFSGSASGFLVGGV